MENFIRVNNVITNIHTETSIAHGSINQAKKKSIELQQKGNIVRNSPKRTRVLHQQCGNKKSTRK